MLVRVLVEHAAVNGSQDILLRQIVVPSPNFELDPINPLKHIATFNLDIKILETYYLLPYVLMKDHSFYFF